MRTHIEQINNSTGEVLYLHHDQAGSTRLLTASTGKVEGKCSYSPYGAPTCEGSAITPLGYDGQYTSSDAGLVYLRNRVYDPTTGQFLTRDPFEMYTDEPYNYAGDDPLSYGDRSGLSAEGFGGVGIPCYWPFCGPPPAATEGVEQLGKGIIERGREAAEGVVHGAEGIWNAITGEGGSSNEGRAAFRRGQSRQRLPIPAWKKRPSFPGEN